jgi:cardiolipin synthase
MTRTDRIWTVPNVISLARLGLVPVFAWLVLARLDAWAVALLAVAGMSDWVDGALARRLGQFSNLGRLLDPAADRAFIIVTAVGLAWRGVVPWWFLGLLLAREVVMGVVLLVLRAKGRKAPQVVFIGKVATLGLMYAFPLLLLASLGGWAGRVAWIAGWAFAIWARGLYWAAAAVYVRQSFFPSHDDAPSPSDPAPIDRTDQ